MTNEQLAIREIENRIARQITELIGTDENTARALIRKELEYLVSAVKDIYGIKSKPNSEVPKL